jgi:hypothetical protein
MMATNLTEKGRDASRESMAGKAKALLVAASVAALGGCVQVSAPDRPIEINLNINIRQEVVVRLQEDVRELIENNPGVF